VSHALALSIINGAYGASAPEEKEEDFIFRNTRIYRVGQKNGLFLKCMTPVLDEV